MNTRRYVFADTTRRHTKPSNPQCADCGTNANDLSRFRTTDRHGDRTAPNRANEANEVMGGARTSRRYFQRTDRTYLETRAAYAILRTRRRNGRVVNEMRVAGHSTSELGDEQIACSRFTCSKQTGGGVQIFSMRFNGARRNQRSTQTAVCSMELCRTTARRGNSNDGFETTTSFRRD